MKKLILFLTCLFFYATIYAQIEPYSENGLDSLVYTDALGIEKVLLFEHKTNKKARYIKTGDKVTFALQSNPVKTKGILENIEPGELKISGATYPLSDIQFIRAKTTHIAYNKRTGKLITGWSSLLAGAGGAMALSGGGAAAFFGIATMGTGVAGVLLLGTPWLLKRDKMDVGKWDSKVVMRDFYNNTITEIIQADTIGGKIELIFGVSDQDLKNPIDAKIEIKSKSSNTMIPGFPRDIKEGNITIPDVEKDDYIVKISAKGYKDSIFTLDKQSFLNVRNTKKQIQLVPEKTELEINITDIETDENVPVRVILTNKNRNESIVLDPKQSENGKYKVKVRTEDDYELEVSNTQGYLFHAENINSNAQNQQIDIKLTPFKVGSKINLNNISFASNSSELSIYTQKELDRVIDLMLIHPTAKIEIAAHTDDVGTVAQNMLLSENRAKNVFDYLISKSLGRDRFICKGYGSAYPLVPNTSEENRAKNRRFELIVVGL